VNHHSLLKHLHFGKPVGKSLFPFEEASAEKNIGYSLVNFFLLTI